VKKIMMAAVVACLATPAFADDAGVHDFLMQEAKPVVESRLKLRGRPQTAPIGGHVVHASWYGGGEKLSRHSADGSRFNPRALTVAHRTLPFGTKVQLSYGGQTVIATVTDRGPAAWTGRSLDVSRGVAEMLGFKARGTANIQMAVLR
jgi:rare lipoprotein A